MRASREFRTSEQPADVGRVATVPVDVITIGRASSLSAIGAESFSPTLTISWSLAAKARILGCGMAINFATSPPPACATDLDQGKYPKGSSFMIRYSDDYSALAWRKSRASAGMGECVEVAGSDSFVHARDSRDQSRVMISVTSAQWLEFLRRIKNGELDPV
jgi:Domain of unknown function (DUF397)